MSDRRISTSIVIESLKCGVALSALALSATAFAQVPAPVEDPKDVSAAPAPTRLAQAPRSTQPSADEDEDGEDEEDEEAIVITGTQIRGIAPPGANTRSVTSEQAEQSGATDTQQLLGTLPQANTFMAFQLPGAGVSAGVSRVPINLPNLRNLPQGSTGNPTTLVMMDGHRIVPSGIEQSAVDAGTVPTSIIERSEIILDGVSSLYGSDAHGGVINFITRKRFDDIRVGARYGFADDYWAVDADVTAGTSWESGGIGFTYNFAKNSPLFNKDRPERLSRNYLLPGNPFTGTACEDHSTATVAGQTLIAAHGSTTLTPALADGASNCAANAFSSFITGQERHGGLAVFSQDITDTIKFEVTGLYSRREAESFFGPFTVTQTVRGVPGGGAPANPWFRPRFPGDTANQTVAFSYGPVLGVDSNRATTISKLWQITPTLTVDVGSWQIRAMAAYGESSVTALTAAKDTALEGVMFAGATQATAINPYDPAASTNRAQIQSLFWTSLRRGEHKFLDLRLTADGPLFTLPGGEVRAAIGVEYIKTNFAQTNTTAATRTVNAPLKASTKPKSVFAEIYVPIFGPDNRTPGFHSLTLSGSARYDDYNEFGTTFNPKGAISWEPVSWLTLRGNIGTSFRAPTAVNKIGGAGNALSCQQGTNNEPGCIPSAFFHILPPGGPLPTPGTIGLAIIGSNEDLKPETAMNWAIGADLRPIEGLTLSATYYYINLKSVIGIPSTGATGGLNLIYQGAPELFLCVNNSPLHSPCTAADLAAAAALAPTNGTTIQQLITNAGYDIAYISDTRTTNLGGNKVAGLDTEVRYVHPFDWGSVDLNVNATWRLKDESQFFATSVPVDGLLSLTPIFRSSATAGVRYGNLRGQVTWQHQSGFRVVAPGAPFPANRRPSQTHIPATDFFNLSFRYDIDSGASILKDTQFTLTVNNVFDTKETISLTTTGGTTGGSTLGRFFQFGFRKSFGGSRN